MVYSDNWWYVPLGITLIFLSTLIIMMIGINLLGIIGILIGALYLIFATSYFAHMGLR